MAMKAAKVLVLGVRRGRRYIPSPGGGTELKRGDTLICYGPLDALHQIAKG